MMRVALFAPELRLEAGGVWQYYQWVVKQLGPFNKWCLVAPSTILSEIEENYPLPDNFIQIQFERFLHNIEGRLSYRLLDPNREKRLFGKLPYSGFVTRNIRNTFYGGDMVTYHIGKMLSQAQVDVIHVPLQQVHCPGAVVGRFPYVINPHDYQHEYFPQYFTPKQIAYRREVWYSDQRKASAIVVHSRQTYDDVIKYLGVSVEKVFYAPYGVIDTFPRPDEEKLKLVQEKYKLPDSYIFYPARAWPHKNHEILVRAAGKLKNHGVEVQIIFTDGDSSCGKIIRNLIQELGLAEQIRFLGRVDSTHMGSLYLLCQAVVVPSLFEQNSGPLLEAIHFSKPVAISNIPELVRTIGPDGLVFDANSINETMLVLEKLWTNSKVITQLEEVSKNQGIELSWDKFVETYQNAYVYAQDHA